MKKAAPVRRSSSLKAQNSNIPSAATEVREKAVEQMTAALEKVRQEAASLAGSLPKPQAVAATTEQALFSLYGESSRLQHGVLRLIHSEETGLLTLPC